jgi:hypothetical protein
MNFSKLIKIGFGKVEAIKTVKSAGLAGTGGILFALIGDILPAPLSDPVVGIPILTWAINTVRKLVTSNE